MLLFDFLLLFALSSVLDLLIGLLFLFSFSSSLEVLIFINNDSELIFLKKVLLLSLLKVMILNLFFSSKKLNLKILLNLIYCWPLSLANFFGFFISLLFCIRLEKYSFNFFQ